MGTGGTVTGVGEYLKSQNPDVKIVAVEPATSPVLSNGEAGPHKIQGIGAGFVPDTLNTKIYDEVIAIENEDAFVEGRSFAKSEGILVGISSGAKHLRQRQILAPARRMQERQLLHFFQIQVTDIFQQHFLMNSNILEKRQGLEI